MSDNPIATSSKLKNPTRYHLLATQRQQQQQGGVSLNHLHDSIDPLAVIEDQHLDFTDCYPTQQFLSPSSNSPLQDYDDMDSVVSPHRISDIPRPYFPNQSNMFDFVSTEDSPSDYSSSVDMFSNSQPSPYFMHLRHNSISSQQEPTMTPPSIYGRLSSSFDQPLSAPAHMGYDFLGGHIAFQPNFSQSLAATGSRSLEEYESIQINHQLLSEKKRRRRESHNAVERRRRENINERIQELGTMLPEAMIEELITVNANGSSNKPNKGAILRKSVDHIRILQQEVTTHKQRIHELEKQLAELST